MKLPCNTLDQTREVGWGVRPWGEAEDLGRGNQAGPGWVKPWLRGAAGIPRINNSLQILGIRTLRKERGMFECWSAVDVES